MGDNRGQTIFLSVIGIATLLVAIIGATFAYFTTQVTKDSVAGGSVDGKTATVGGTTFTFNESGTEYKQLTYPGGLAAVGAQAKVVKSEPTDANDYEATYSLEIHYTNPTATALTWDLYEMDSEVEDLNAGCQVLHKEVSGEVHMWIGSSTDSNENTESSCSYADETTKFPPANKIASGKLASGKEVDTTINSESKETEIDQATKGNLDNKKIDTTIENGKYYYLVVKYPNDSSDQTAGDKGKTISASVKIVDGSIHVDTKAGA